MRFGLNSNTGATAISISLEGTDSQIVNITDDGRAFTHEEVCNAFVQGHQRVKHILRCATILGYDFLVFCRGPHDELSATFFSPHSSILYKVFFHRNFRHTRKVLLAQANKVTIRYVSCHRNPTNPENEVPYLMETLDNDTSLYRFVCKNSPFSTLSLLLQQFRRIKGQGTTVCLFRNKKTASVHHYHLSLGHHDIQIDVMEGDCCLYQPRSLRKHLEMTYLDPKATIYIQGDSIQPKHPWGALFWPHRIKCCTSKINPSWSKNFQSKCTVAKARHFIDGDENNTCEKQQDEEDYNLELTLGINVHERWRQGLLLYIGGQLVLGYYNVGVQKANAPWDVDGCGGVVAVLTEGVLQQHIHADGLRISSQEIHRLERPIGMAISHYWKLFKASHNISTTSDLNRFWESCGYSLSSSPVTWTFPPSHTNVLATGDIEDIPITNKRLCPHARTACHVNDIEQLHLETTDILVSDNASIDTEISQIISRQPLLRPHVLEFFPKVGEGSASKEIGKKGDISTQFNTSAEQIQAKDYELCDDELEPLQQNFQTVWNYMLGSKLLMPSIEGEPSSRLSLESLREIDESTLLRQYQQRRKTLQIPTEQELEVVQKEYTEELSLLQEFLHQLGPLLTTLNGGYIPEFDFSDPGIILLWQSLLICTPVSSQKSNIRICQVYTNNNVK
eukprot:gene93-3486_t